MAVHEGIKKLWMYLIPLAILAGVAIFGEKLGLPNPFDEGDEVQKEVPVATADSIPEIQAPESDVAIDTALENNESADTIIREKQWRLVIGSFPTQEQAENVRKNIDDPQIEILYVDYIPTYRIVYRSFYNKKEAQDEYGKVQSQFPKAWLVYY